MIEDEIILDDEGTDELFEHLKIVCDPGQSQLRIDKYIQDRVSKLSRNKIQNYIRAGSVKVNDKEIKSNYKVRPNDVISVVLPHPPPEGGVLPENIPLNVVYEDDDLMIINKPAGLVVHPGYGVKNGTLVNALAYYFKQKELPIMEGNDADRPGLIHRIDKDTTGLMVIAKNDYAMAHLSKQFFEHTINRKYLALIWGEFDEAEGTITGNIGRHPRNRMQMTIFPEGEEGKHAVTHYKTIEGMYYVSLVECKLETGRTHQIRAHMKYLGHPLFSDERYGGNVIIKGTVFTKYKQFVENCFKMMPRQALHAKSLGFVHPTTGKEMYFESELPEDFQNVLDKWRHYLSFRKEKLEDE
jgi:23S rRNA pseudouridine1911/1915/1917 synthase